MFLWCFLFCSYLDCYSITIFLLVVKKVFIEVMFSFLIAYVCRLFGVRNRISTWAEGIVFSANEDSKPSVWAKSSPLILLGMKVFYRR